MGPITNCFAPVLSPVCCLSLAHTARLLKCRLLIACWLNICAACQRGKGLNSVCILNNCLGSYTIHSVYVFMECTICDCCFKKCRYKTWPSRFCSGSGLHWLSRAFGEVPLSTAQFACHGLAYYNLVMAVWQLLSVSSKPNSDPFT